jgi:hypothetical protein
MIWPIRWTSWPYGARERSQALVRNGTGGGEILAGPARHACSANWNEAAAMMNRVDSRLAATTSVAQDKAAADKIARRRGLFARCSTPVVSRRCPGHARAMVTRKELKAAGERGASGGVLQRSVQALSSDAARWSERRRSRPPAIARAPVQRTEQQASSLEQTRPAWKR